MRSMGAYGVAGVLSWVNVHKELEFGNSLGRVGTIFSSIVPL